MGAGSVTNPPQAKRPAWGLNAPHDKRTQGVVVSGYTKLPSAVALFLEFTWAGGTAGKGAWLDTLNAVSPVTNADSKEQPRAAALAFTWTGLQKMGLPADTLASFSAPFREGMYQEDRLRRLGDRIKEQWQPTVVNGGPLWSANIPVQQDNAPPSPGDGPKETPEIQATTPNTVHALLLLYEIDDDRATKWADRVTGAIQPHQIRVVHKLSLDLRLDPVKGFAREHFGFADGLSQPIPFDEKSGDENAPDCLKLSNGQPVTRDPLHGVPLGEILLGHINAHHEKAPCPVVPDEKKALDAGLDTEGAPEGFRNLGLDGSYMVVRELKQDVAAFWRSLKSNAERICAHDPGAKNIVNDSWLAERVVGRTINGDLLCPGGGVLPPNQYGEPENDFRFRQTDPFGVGCPIGSHVRRANPRDSQAKDMASADTLLNAANNHRILRRGRKYGPTIADIMKDDGVDRGLLFVCLNTDIARQFEFVQQTWLLNQNFGTLFDETDPLVGPKGRFTIPNDPLRRIVDVETFIQMKGGEYFFLPSIPALNYLARL